jgi:hypothetical protein
MSRQLYRSFHIQQTIDKQEDVYNETEREYKNLQKMKNKTSEQINQMMEYRKFLEDIAEQINYLEEL